LAPFWEPMASAKRALSNSSALCTSQVIKPPCRGGERHLLTRQTPGTGAVRVVRLVEMMPAGITSVAGATGGPHSSDHRDLGPHADPSGCSR
jgi:hypothetical protein